MLGKRLARLLGSVLMLAALAGSVLAGDLGTEAANDAFEWGASFDLTVVDGPAAGATPLESAAVAGGHL